MKATRINSLALSSQMIRHGAKALFCVLGLLALQQVAFAQTAYPLVCRGGGQMKMQLSAGPVANGAPFTGNRVYNIINLWFERASQRYDSRNASALRPGQCAWLDRAVNRFEPNKINFYTEVAIFVEFNARGRHPLHMRTSATQMDAQSMQTRRFLSLMSSTEVFTIMAWNKEGAYFRVEDIRSGDR
ncbi:MAG: hypothetical protein AB8C46_15290 [Burkholderiaceae bacterium]